MALVSVFECLLYLDYIQTLLIDMQGRFVLEWHLLLSLININEQVIDIGEWLGEWLGLVIIGNIL